MLIFTRVKDCIEDMATFTLLAKFFFHNLFLQCEGSRLDGSFIQWCIIILLDSSQVNFVHCNTIPACGNYYWCAYNFIMTLCVCYRVYVYLKYFYCISLLLPHNSQFICWEIHNMSLLHVTAFHVCIPLMRAVFTTGTKIKT